MIEKILTDRPEIVTALREAFDTMMPDTYEFPDGSFIGVHLPDAPDKYEIIERRNFWCYGRKVQCSS